jgi:hypothetical protein
MLLAADKQVERTHRQPVFLEGMMDSVVVVIVIIIIYIYSHAPFVCTLFHIYLFLEDIAFKCISFIFGRVSFILRNMPEGELA